MAEWLETSEPLKMVPGFESFKWQLFLPSISGSLTLRISFWRATVRAVCALCARYIGIMRALGNKRLLMCCNVAVCADKQTMR